MCAYVEIVSVCVCMQVGTHVQLHVYVGRGQRLVPGIFFNHFSLYILSQGLSLNPEITDLTSLICQLSPGIPCLCLPIAEVIGSPLYLLGNYGMLECEIQSLLVSFTYWTISPSTDLLNVLYSNLISPEFSSYFVIVPT